MARVSIEDCLKNIENRFALVMIASDRARGLMTGETPLLRTKNKEAVTALREVADGVIEGLVPKNAGGNNTMDDDMPVATVTPIGGSDESEALAASEEASSVSADADETEEDSGAETDSTL